jgi:hypothetical protein
MAINPNTDFTAGQVLTAAEQNRFPRGIVAQAESTTSSASITTSETVLLTASTFTAVANRYYKITYYEPMIQSSVTAPGYMTFRIRLTNTSGTTYQYADVEPVGGGSDGQIVQVQVITTLTAGSTVIVGTGRASSQSFVAFGNAGVGAKRQIYVEDIGPA